MRIKRLPDPFWWWSAFWDWRDERKSSWRTRFALWPTKMTDPEAGYVWLQRYWSKGTKKHIPLRFHKTGGLFGGPTMSGGWSYWNWHKVDSRLKTGLK
jgi:hypothetical protein